MDRRAEHDEASQRGNILQNRKECRRRRQKRTVNTNSHHNARDKGQHRMIEINNTKE